MSSQITFSSLSITENLVSTLQKNAFSFHQMLGIMEKYKKISPEECKSLRKNTAKYSCESIIFLRKKVKIDRKKEDVQFDLREDARFDLREGAEGARLDFKEVKGLDFDVGYDESESSLTSQRKIISELNDLRLQKPENIYKYLCLIHNTSMLRKSLSNPNTFNHDKHEAYKRALEEFIQLKQDLNQLEQLAGFIATGELQHRLLSETLENIGNDKLPASLLDKISTATTQLLEKFSSKSSEILSKSFTDLRQCQSTFDMLKDRLDKCLEEILKVENMNLESLREFGEKIDAKEGIIALKKGLEELKSNIPSESLNLKSMLQLYTELSSLQEKTAKLAEYQSKVSTILSDTIEKLEGLSGRIEHYKDKDVYSFFRNLGRKMKQPKDGHSKDDKIDAATTLLKNVTTHSNGISLDLKATEQGKLGKLTEEFRDIVTSLKSEITESGNKYGRGVKR